MPDDTVTVLVEIPAGSRNKYEVDPQTGHLYLDRTLSTSTRYPADYGHIEGTLAADGDPLDALVFVEEPTFAGCRIRSRPVALFRMWDEAGSDEKILCVPLQDPTWSHVHDLEDLRKNLLEEIEHFFSVYKDLEGKPTGTEGFEKRDAAVEVIKESRERAASQGPQTRE